MPTDPTTLAQRYGVAAVREAERVLLQILAAPGVVAASQVSPEEFAALVVQVRDYGDFRVRQVRVLDAAIAEAAAGDV